jgi:hypothetical protein
MSFIGPGQYRWVGGTCKSFDKAYRNREKYTWCYPTKLGDEKIRLRLDDTEKIEDRPQYSLQKSEVLTMPGSKPLTEYDLLKKEDNDTMLRTFLRLGKKTLG